MAKSRNRVYTKVARSRGTTKTASPKLRYSNKREVFDALPSSFPTSKPPSFSFKPFQPSKFIAQFLPVRRRVSPINLHSLGVAVGVARNVCIARRIRREVLHANGSAGGRVRPPVWSDKSKVRCK